MSELVLKYDHNVVEHLGLKLYQNRPTNVLAELVANAWDADATKVWVYLVQDEATEERLVAVCDNGCGMTKEVLVNDYMIIGKAKRPLDNPKIKSAGGRYLMGRKGLGKLAPFGIATTVDVFTISVDQQATKRVTWFSMNLSDLKRQGGASYTPEIFCFDSEISELDKTADKTGIISAFLDRLNGSTGTIILLKNLSVKRKIDQQKIVESMGRRFTVTLVRPDFAVFVNDVRVTENEALPDFDFRIPADGKTTEDVGDLGEVSYWVGFVKKADWPQDQAGVGVFAHGKIAQDRPFSFGLKGREVYTRYMYGVLEADFLDEQMEDLASTDRTSIDWDNEKATILYEWGQAKTRKWITQYEQWKREKEKEEIAERLDRQIEGKMVPKVTNIEKDAIVALLSQVTPNLGKDEEAKNNLTVAVTQAWVHRPMRKLIKELWDNIQELPNPVGNEMALIVSKLNENAVPESLSLAVTFAQRAYALTLLHDLITYGKEPDLQKLIEVFPWILEPEMERLTANQTLKKTVMEAENRGLMPTRVDSTNVGADENDRADFVFLSMQDYQEIVVVEIKHPGNDLNYNNREQLGAYMTHLERIYPETELRGILIGTNGMKLAAKREDMEIRTWNDIFVKSRQAYVFLLSALMKNASPDPDDDRVRQIVEFGGEATIELLQRIAKHDPELQELVESLSAPLKQ
ncbi:MAG: ATP-binding protein [Deltaproteobacteria bacterium]|nr:ATP-binding protein [Deltaproteobacteria bacterium]